MTLNRHHVAVLNKGLNFAPSMFKPTPYQIDKDLIRFERTLQLKYFFNDDNNDPHKIFENNPEWWPKKLSPLITNFCKDLQSYLTKTMANL